MKLCHKEVNAIAQELEAGMRVFLNKETLEYRSVLDWEEIYDPEFVDEEVENIENEWTNYIVLTKMETRDAFRVMEDFIDEVDDPRLREDLIKILERKSPFANFKAEIESSAFRQRWFDFRTKSYENAVREQLDYENIEYE